MTQCAPADGVLSSAEFKRHLEHASALDFDDRDIDGMYGKNLTLGMTVGKVWVELHGSDSSDSAFAEIDANGDKKLTWDEWVHEMFHDQPQEVRPVTCVLTRRVALVLLGRGSCSLTCVLRVVRYLPHAAQPLFVDGEDGDIFTEELMLSFDKNGDKHLTLDEVRAFVGKHMRREDVDPDYTGRQVRSVCLFVCVCMYYV